MSSSKQSTFDIEQAMKDTKMNAFEACKHVFIAEPNAKKPKTMLDKMDLFFCNSNMMPLLVQENYLKVYPTYLKGNTKREKDLCHLQLLSESMESMCTGDYIGKLIRSTSSWSLMPAQAVFSTVVPGDKLACQTFGLAGFPSWFGKNSKKTRVDRVLQELQKHMRINISANKVGVGMDYLSVLKTMLSKPLIKKGADGIPQVLKIMHEYCLTRDDFDTILELSTWPGQKDPMTLIETKTKAAFTRAYNKESHKNPFSIVDFKKLKGNKAASTSEEGEGEEYGGEEDIEEVEFEDDNDIESDAMIKMKKKAPVKAASVKRSADESSKSTTASKKKKV
jgi:replication factor C subunit 1